MLSCLNCSVTRCDCGPACKGPCMDGFINCTCSNPAKLAVKDIGGNNIRTLVAQANQLGVGHTIPDTVSVKDLEDIIHAVAKKAFSDTYQYAYDGPNSIPGDCPKGTTVRSVQNFVTVRTGDVKVAKTCFNKLLSDGGNPDWAVSQAVTDISSTAETIFKDASLNEWKIGSFRGSYKNPDGEEKFEARAVYVYANVNLSEGFKKSSHSVVYYLAVHF